MNNHWGTNYRAYQESPTTFRFILRPHRRSDPAEASRFAIGFTQPLLTIASDGPNIRSTPLLRLEPAEVLMSALKPADSGTGLIVRLFNASRATKEATLVWGERRPKAVFLSDTSEKSGQPLTGTVRVPSCGLVTLRVELE
jgi:alpha-mannosidase